MGSAPGAEPAHRHRFHRRADGEYDTTAARPPLRDRLLALREELHQRLAEAELLEPSWLRMLADTETVIAALDRQPGHERRYLL